MAGVQAGMPGGAQGPLGMLRASLMVQQLLPGGIMPQMPQPEEEKKPQFITELEINDFPQHARWKVCAQTDCIQQFHDKCGEPCSLAKCWLNICLKVWTNMSLSACFYMSIAVAHMSGVQ